MSRAAGVVDRYTSHVIFLMHFTRVYSVHIHHKAQGSRRAKAQVSARTRHFISMPSMVSG